MDVIAAAKEKEADDRKPFIVPMDFRTEYEQGPNGEAKPVDWVTWIKKGVQSPPVLECKVSRMPRYYTAEWGVIEPYYLRWKEGQSAPVNGTALAAWPGATPQLVKALEPYHIRSVEDLIQLEDSSISKIAIPGLRMKVQQAKAFLEARKNVAGVAGEVTKLREDNAFLRGELKALQANIAELMADKGQPQVGEAIPAPKHRGWPKGKPRKPKIEPEPI